MVEQTVEDGADWGLARVVYDQLVPHRSTELTDEVRVYLEYTPSDGPEWLGEAITRQPTQVDVAFEVYRGSVPLGFLLIEVKLSERLGHVGDSSTRRRCTWIRRLAWMRGLCSQIPKRIAGWFQKRNDAIGRS